VTVVIITDGNIFDGSVTLLHQGFGMTVEPEECDCTLACCIDG
jgi:hypothetical protein